MRRTKSTFLLIVWIAVLILLPVGWIMNIFDVIATDFQAPLTAETILHVVGIVVVPLGAVMGIFF